MNRLDKEQAFRDSLETKENFVCAKVTENNLYDFIFYKVFKGDSEKMYEALADYYSDDYDNYCDNVIATWYDEEDV